MLRRLRGICTHPQVNRHISRVSPILRFVVIQVGQLPRQGDRLNKSGALKSMTDVLEVRLLVNFRISIAFVLTDSVVNERSELEELDR